MHRLHQKRVACPYAHCTYYTIYIRNQVQVKLWKAFRNQDRPLQIASQAGRELETSVSLPFEHNEWSLLSTLSRRSSILRSPNMPVFSHFLRHILISVSKTLLQAPNPVYSFTACTYPRSSCNNSFQWLHLNFIFLLLTLKGHMLS